jgi:hypothetical protein
MKREAGYRFTVLQFYIARSHRSETADNVLNNVDYGFINHTKHTYLSARQGRCYVLGGEN